MKSKVNRLRVAAVLALGTAAVLVAGTGVTVAAAGGSFVLGHTNHEKATSVLVNTGRGPALSFRTKSAKTPPFAVSNSTKVAKLNADKLDGLSSEQLQRRVSGKCPTGEAVQSIAVTGAVGCAGSTSFKRIVIVHPGATATAGGIALLAAVNGAADATAASPVVVFVEPGTYDLGDQTLTVPDNVDLRGSGLDATHITGESSDVHYIGVEVPSATLEDLSVGITYTGPASSTFTEAVHVTGAGRLLNDSISSAAGTATGYVTIGLHRSSGQAATISATITTGSEYGLLSEDGDAGAGTVWDSEIEGAAAAVGVTDPSGPGRRMTMVGSQLIGGSNTEAPWTTCIASFDGNSSLLNNDCG